MKPMRAYRTFSHRAIGFRKPHPNTGCKVLIQRDT